jgi:hypothetical protein
MDAESIELQLQSEVRAKKGHDLFTGNSALDLVAFIREGARAMAAEGRTSEDDLNEAKANLHRFFEEMETGRVELEYDEYREDVVEWARSKLCPMWPFCTTA